MSYESSLAKEKQRDSQEYSTSIASISESDYINNIINSIGEVCLFPNFSIEPIFKILKEKQLLRLLSSFNYICNSKLLFNKLSNKCYEGVIIHLLLYLLETENTRLNNLKKIFIRNIFLLIKKLYLSKNYSEKEIILTIKLLAFSSIYARKEIKFQNISLKNKKIKYYKQRFCLSIELVKLINVPKITIEFCEFIEISFLKFKPNLVLLQMNEDLLDLLYLKDEDGKIITFLSNLYSFKFRGIFMKLFVNKIQEIYLPKNKNINQIQALKKINNILSFLSNIQILEDKKYEQDSYILPKGFICNNNIMNGISTNNIITLNNSFSLIFSFCFIPEKKIIKKKIVEEKTNIFGKKGTKKIPNSECDEQEYPILNFFPIKEGMSFYIKDGYLFHKEYCSEKILPLTAINENFTYIIYYTIKQKKNYLITIRGENMNITHEKKFHGEINNKQITINLGKFNQNNFEGYLGPVLLFNKNLEENDLKYIIPWKGSYERILYFHDYNMIGINKYDKLTNYINENMSNKQEIFYNSIKYFKENENLSNNILAFISPLNEEKIPKKNIYYNTSFVETKIKFNAPPNIENCGVLFFRNNYTQFEFLKFEGFNYLVLILELLGENAENIKTDEDKTLLLTLFTNVIKYSNDLLFILNMDYYKKEIRNLLFAVEKCVYKICLKIKMTNEMSYIICNWLITLSTQNPEFSPKKLEHFINIRNELYKFVLNISLYDITKYSIIELFFVTLNNSIIKNYTGLTNLEIFQKILEFSKIYLKIKNIQTVKNNKEFKKLKKEYNNLLVNYLNCFGKIQPYAVIFKSFPNDFIFTFRSYQLFKDFYLVSEYYFTNISDKIFLLSWKYFIDLYEYLVNKNNDNNKELSKKEEQIIMALCLRFIFEYPICEDFFKNYKLKNKKSLKNIEIRKKRKLDIMNLERTNLVEEKTKNDWINIKTNINLINDNNEDLKINGSEINNNKDYYNQSNNTNQNNISDSPIGANNTKNNKKNIYKKDSNFRSYSTTPLRKNVKNNNYFNKNNNINNLNIINIIDNESNDINTNIKIDGQNNNNIIINQAQKFDLIHYIDYYSFPTLFPKLYNSKNINDFTFKSLILFILEKNNNITISQSIKYNFIAKTKTYADLRNPDYEKFLKINYYNKETKVYLLNILTLFENNILNFSEISYEILIYLIVRTLEERINNSCVFNHLIESRKICCKIFFLVLNHNKKASDVLLHEFDKIIEFIIPYHKNPFIFTFLYDLSNQKSLYHYGLVLINLLLVASFENNKSKFFYQFKINSVLLLYRVIKSNSIDISQCNLSEKGLKDIFIDELIYSKFNLLSNISKKKKMYVELIYDIMMNLYIKTKNNKYYNVLKQMLIIPEKNMQVLKTKTFVNKTKIYCIDVQKKSDIKNNITKKFFKNYEHVDDDIPLCIKFLNKSLRFYNKTKENEIQINIFNFINLFYFDSKIIFNNKAKTLKKLKNLNAPLMFIINSLDAKNIYSQENEKEIINKYNVVYEKYKKEKQYENNNNENDKKNNSLLNDINDNIKNNEQRDSFTSCKSPKNQKVKCITNQKKKFKENIKKKEKYSLTELISNLDNNSNLNIFPENNLINLEDEENNIINNSTTLQTNSEHGSVSNSSTNKDLISNLSSNFIEVNKFNFDHIDSYNKVILFPKQTLLEQIFALFFTDIFFNNEPFIKMKQYFKYYAKKYYNTEISIDNFFNYPIITKNYIPKKLYFGGLFVKHDLNFFDDKYFHISHPYFINKAEESKSKRVFKKISDQEDINYFLFDKNESIIVFHVDLITNRDVVFGELIITKYIIYFHNIDKDKFLKGKSDEEVEKWLLCSSKIDYSFKNKKLYIFKKEILEIINRRFLYLFQACEFYLKNGKSYYFNFYSEEQKIKFFNLFNENNPYNINIITDLKTDFKKKEFTKLWQNNLITNLEYLLFINKYACRSYNDINQYPVFPWLKIYGDKIRDLKYTISAQTEEKREMLKEKYSLSSEHFPFHYTTHYSNASFLIYYLMRINPFTDNQITLQDNKFDSPGRQFNSIDEIQKILYTTSQPREIIPEFFITTEFYYNYNCNFFGIRNKKEFLNNLKNKDGYDTPLDYILSNAVRFETKECKSDINFFIDNVFGASQMGGKEKCNTYDKYSYQEMVDLKQKIIHYKEKKLSLDEIKMKIEMKSNKILSFGQTPYKLFEDKHPRWIETKLTVNDILTGDNRIKEDFIYQTKNKIYFIGIYNNINNKRVLYAFTSIPSLNDKNIFNYEIKFLNENLEEDETKTIKISKKIKFFTKNRIFNNELYCYKYNPKFIMINFNLNIFIFCRFEDNSFMVINSKGEKKNYLTDSLVTCITKLRENNFITGHHNGKIIEWSLILGGDELKIKRNYIDHISRVSGIYYSGLLGLIISTGDDGKIMIRKYYDLSLLSMIDLHKNKIPINIKISHCFLYILIFDNLIKKHIVEIFSVNGIKVGEGKYDYINGIDIDKNGNLLIGYYKTNKIEIYNPALTKKLHEVNLNYERTITIEDNKDNNKKKIKNSDNYSEQHVSNLNINDKILLIDFCYIRNTSTVYCCYSNGLITQKNMPEIIKLADDL